MQAPPVGLGSAVGLGVSICVVKVVVQRRGCGMVSGEVASTAGSMHAVSGGLCAPQLCFIATWQQPPAVWHRSGRQKHRPAPPQFWQRPPFSRRRPGLQQPRDPQFGAPTTAGCEPARSGGTRPGGGGRSGSGARRGCPAQPATMSQGEAGLVNQKYALLPAFLQAKGLIRQHVSR